AARRKTARSVMRLCRKAPRMTTMTPKATAAAARKTRPRRSRRERRAAPSGGPMVWVPGWESDPGGGIGRQRANDRDGGGGGGDRTAGGGGGAPPGGKVRGRGAGRPPSGESRKGGRRAARQNRAASHNSGEGPTRLGTHNGRTFMITFMCVHCNEELKVPD